MKAKILLIDDDTLVLTSVSSLLKKHGYDVIEASDGPSAVEVVKDQEFDLIICDIRMPSLDGLETVKQIRKALEQLGRKRVTEMFLTGYTERNIEKEAVQMGVAKYIYKPFDMAEFLSIVDKVVDHG